MWVKFNITEKIILITNNLLHTITWGKYLDQVICNIATFNKRGPMKYSHAFESKESHYSSVSYRNSK